ncbi:unnamed protein product, partial [Adineta ricciae]
HSSHPNSIALADLNNDEQIDIVVANPGTNTIGVFLAFDNETFASQQTYSTGISSHPQSVLLNHFNHDQYLDIAVANYGTNSIGVFFACVNETFQNQISISTKAFRPWFLVADDFNKDNYTDLIILFPSTDNLGIFMGKKNGLFEDLELYSTGYDSHPYSLTLGDLNRDSYVDMVVVTNGTNNVEIFYNDGSGKFQNAILYSTGRSSNATSVVVGDLNNDQYLDIIVANYNHQNIGIFLNLGNGMFAQQMTHKLATNSFPQFVNVGYFNQDNDLDVVVVDSLNSQIHILLGHGNGSLSASIVYDLISKSNPLFIAVYDFDRDNRSDLVVANSDGNNILMLNGFSSEPSARQTTYLIDESARPSSLVVYDFNRDNQLDIVVNNFGGNSIVIFYGTDAGSFVQGDSYSTGENSSPRQITTGDFNNDNRMDILIACPGSGNVGVFLGQENGTFAPMVPYWIGNGSSPWFVTTHDLNNDTYIDLVASNKGVKTITIWFGLGNGSFTNMTTYSTGNHSIPKAIVVADVNNDNHLDLIFANQISDRPGVFLGYSNGSFELITTFVTEIDEDGFMLVLADFNRDNYLDCAISYINSAIIGIFFGFGNGTFRDRVIYSTTAIGQPYYITTTDFNQDNYLDIAVAIFSASEVIIYFGDGQGDFKIGRRYSTDYGSNLYALAVVDLNSDNQLEMVATYWGTGYVGVLTPYNAARFSNQSTYSTGSAPYPYSLAMADFNNDNQLDVVVANSGTDDLTILFGSSNNDTFRDAITYLMGSDSNPQYVITGDVNKDNHSDIVVLNSKSNTLNLIYGYGNGSFADQMVYSTGDDSRPFSLVMNDINNDGRNDFIVANEMANTIDMFLGFDYTTFEKANSYSIENSTDPTSIAVNDFNNDNQSDMAIVFPTNCTLVILLGQGNGSFVISTIYSTGENSNPIMVLADNVNDDNPIDLIVANRDSDDVIVFLGHSNGTFLPMITSPIGKHSTPCGIALADFNADGIQDIVSANYGTNSISILIGFANGSFSLIYTYATGDFSGPKAVATGDLNNDGLIDIVVAHYDANTIGIFLANGKASFVTQIVYTVCYECWPNWVTINDFNKDNKSDIAVATFNNEYISVYLGYGNSSFANAMQYSTGDGSAPIYHTIGDFNQDGALDIVVANSGIDNIVVLFGFSDGTFLLGKAYSTGTGSIPRAIGIADFNHDQRLDIVVGNYQSGDIRIFLGGGHEPFAGMRKLNTGDESRPHFLAVEDLNRDGWVDIVVANYGTDNIGIFFGSGHGSFNTMITYPTGTNSGPFLVAIGDFNNDNQLDMVVTNSFVNTIGIFQGNVNGTFLLTSTYFTGDRASPHTVIVNDLNNDHQLDIIVANSGTSNIFILYGFGNGTFANEMLFPLGYQYLPYSIVINDLNKDGWMDMVIACYQTNNIETLVKMCSV